MLGIDKDVCKSAQLADTASIPPIHSKCEYFQNRVYSIDLKQRNVVVGLNNFLHVMQVESTTNTKILASVF